MTTVPTQALFLMNAKLMKRAGRSTSPGASSKARRGARRGSRRSGSACSTGRSRPPKRADRAAFLAELRNLDRRDDPRSRELRAWAELCHALLASNEFLVRL